MEKAKGIIAHFIKTSPHTITDTTVMDHTVIPSSILQHRMFALLADEGYIVQDPGAIVSFGDFKAMLENGSSFSSGTEKAPEISPANITCMTFKKNESIAGFNVGIDIEELSHFEASENYNSTFYINNFSAEEIEYCKSKVVPRTSFAALFSLKESIVKADNTYKGIPFKTINIKHSDQGMPQFIGFSLSASHTENYVITIAIKNETTVNAKITDTQQVVHNADYFSKNTVLLIGLASILLSVTINILIG
ncbi:holo-ACP synthase [Sulfuricurvum sp.]|uniref:holo-ACP synthase n=1 Tax=Sulfuricurvum sp. TaxID=2025608 RepID=UPI0025CF700D|nr:4'-phosphopantetheinyl transferase superfamily protein [Sulfuricurvum sp.]